MVIFQWLVIDRNLFYKNKNDMDGNKVIKKMCNEMLSTVEGQVDLIV